MVWYNIPDSFCKKKKKKNSLDLSSVWKKHLREPKILNHKLF